MVLQATSHWTILGGIAFTARPLPPPPSSVRRAGRPLTIRLYVARLEHPVESVTCHICRPRHRRCIEARAVAHDEQIAPLRLRRLDLGLGHLPALEIRRKPLVMLRFRRVFVHSTDTVAARRDYGEGLSRSRPIFRSPRPRRGSDHRVSEGSATTTTTTPTPPYTSPLSLSLSQPHEQRKFLMVARRRQS